MGFCEICSQLLREATNDENSNRTEPCQMHKSWHSLCSSIEQGCSICWVLWRHIRSSPTAVPRQEERAFASRWAVREGYDREGRWPLSSIWLLYDDEDGVEHTVILNPFPSNIRPEEASSSHKIKSSPTSAVSSEPHRNDLDSKPSVGQIRTWISHCLNNHKRCRSRTSLLFKGRVEVPTRLIDLHDRESQTWSLVVTNGDTEKYSTYVALSHRWTSHVPQLNQSNFRQLQEGQLDKCLPGDYQDVALLCRALDVRFLWIDSLCIFQDSPEDFRKEAATMASVYMNALCTFSICWPSSTGGCLTSRDPSVILPIEIPPITAMINDGPGLRISREIVMLFDVDEWKGSILDTPVNRRGWVYQERILSSRILYLGNEQLYWECDQSLASEALPHGWPLRFVGSQNHKKQAREPAIEQDDDEAFHRFTWPDLVEAYSKADLTYEADRLVAMSGVAKLLSQRSSEEYFAGLWRSQILPGLHWNRIEQAASPRDCSNCTAPSWSWAKSLGPVEYDTEARSCYLGLKDPDSWAAVCQPLAQVKDVAVNPAGEDRFGSIDSGFIDLGCLLIPVQVHGQGRTSDTNKFRIGLTVFHGPVQEGTGDWVPLTCNAFKVSLDKDFD